jgi:alanine racemase
VRTWIEIEPNALKANYRAFCQLVGKSKVMPVVKANAYGHGLDLVASILFEENPDQLGVNYAMEGARLRELGFVGTILVLGPIFPDDLTIAAKFNLEVMLAGPEILRSWIEKTTRPKAHLKFDTGLSRQGFLSTEAANLASQLAPMTKDLVGICTHFANVEDVLEHEYALNQLVEFEVARQAFLGGSFRLKAHAASSASALLLPASHYDFCRVGISLYGLWPSKSSRLSFLQTHQSLLDLQPVLSWKAGISTIKHIKSGRFIGYGCTYRAVKDMTLAVIPVGYYEGFPRIASNHGAYTLIRGQRCPLIGRISMNMMIVDVSHVDGICDSDTVTLLGRDGQETISATDFADWAQTIHYEALTRLNAIIPRIKAVVTV